MITRLISIFLLIALVACKGKNSIPSDILPPSKMQAVLWDVMRADQFVSDYVVKNDTTKNKLSTSLGYYEQIFSIHKIKPEEFSRSLTYYKEHPDLFKVVMDSMSKMNPDAPTQIVQPPAPTELADTVKKKKIGL